MVCERAREKMLEILNCGIDSAPIKPQKRLIIRVSKFEDSRTFISTLGLQKYVISRSTWMQSFAREIFKTGEEGFD